MKIFYFHQILISRVFFFERRIKSSNENLLWLDTVFESVWCTNIKINTKPLDVIGVTESRMLLWWLYHVNFTPLVTRRRTCVVDAENDSFCSNKFAMLISCFLFAKEKQKNIHIFSISVECEKCVFLYLYDDNMSGFTFDYFVRILVGSFFVLRSTVRLTAIWYLLFAIVIVPSHFHSWKM